MIVGARAIVRAQVLNVQAAYDDQEDTVFTYVTLRLREVIKGSLSERRIVLKEFGGETASRATVIFGAPQFTPGERVFLYLDTWPDGSMRVHQMFLGKFSIETDPATGNDYVVRGAPEDGVTVLQNVSRDGITDRMELNAYRDMIRAGVAATSERAEEFERTYYPGVPLLGRPADYEGKSRSGLLELQFKLLGNSRWFEPDSGQTVTYFVNTASAPTTTVMADISAALAAWSTVPGCSLRLANGGTTTNCTTVGNTIVFNNCDSQFSPGGSGCSGVLARGGFSSSGQTRVVNGVTFNKIVRGTVTFNPFMTCFLGNSCNLQEVATHEIGHTVGMGHSFDQADPGTPTAVQMDATMFWRAHGDGRCAAVRTDDINGIRFIYPGAATPAAGTDTIGLYNPASSMFFLRNTNSSAPADLTFSYGPAGAGWTPLAGDWNGDGTDTIGLFNPASSTFFLRNSNTSAPADLTFGYGPAGAGWLPIAGDWNGDGVDTIGLYNPASSTFFLRNSNTTGVADLTFNYGPAGAGWRPVSGDWNGDNTDTIGLYNPTTSMFFLRNSNSSAPADLTFSYGPAGAGWTPVVGDWNGDGTDTIGLYNPSSSMFFLRNTNSSAPADLTFSYGPAGAGWRPVVGDWNGS